LCSQSNPINQKTVAKALPLKKVPRMTGAAPDIIELIDRPFFSTGKSAAEKLTTCQNGANDACNDLDQEPVDRPCLFETIALHG
jgi:hypothetical protein